MIVSMGFFLYSSPKMEHLLSLKMAFEGPNTYMGVSEKPGSLLRRWSAGECERAV